MNNLAILKFRNHLIILLSAAVLLFGCTKDEDVNPEGPSVGTLKTGITGDCMPFIVNGIFKVDSILTNNNYIDVQVEVTIGGTFDIKTDSVNGYSFKKKGTLGTGLNVIRLYASGKPLLAGVNNFTLNYGLTSCRFSVTVFDAGAGTALYTLGGSPGDCSISTINGNYIVGQAMTGNNNVELTVNVSAVGTYIIPGTTINGVRFSANGTFLNPGIQNIFLYASGTPGSQGLFNYPVNNFTTSCNFPITYTSTVTNASYALSGSPGNCTGAVVNGTYTAGTALNAQNFVVINVNVLSPGLYTIATSTINGISFSATGTFNITGQRQVNLAGTGTPIVPGIFNNIPVSGSGNTCGISVTCN